jgi:hypothetical protein
MTRAIKRHWRCPNHHAIPGSKKYFRPGNARAAVLGGSNKGPSLNLNFINGSPLDSRIAFTRASAASYYDATGTLRSAASNVPRIDYGPSPGATPLGLLIEESRTNSIRNNTMVGAVAGTPGTMPTNWGVGATASLTTNVIGFGSSAGIPYVDVQITGTPTAAAYSLFSEGLSTVAAASGQAWTVSAYFALVGGALTNVGGIAHRVRSYTTGGGSPVEASAGTPFTPTGTLTRQSESVTLANATSAQVVNQLLVTLTVGNAVNFTIRIGAPQLELGAFATSPILTSGSAATRAADVARIPTASWYNQAAGSIVFDANMPIVQTGFNAQLCQIDDGTSTNRLYLYEGQNGTIPGFSTSVASIQTTALSTANSYTAGASFKTGATWSPTGFAIALNGGAVATAGPAGLPPGITGISLGNRFDAARAINGYIRRVRYWPRALGSVELQGVTT